MMRRRVPFVAQLQAEECGPACLTMILAAHGRHVPLTEIRDACGVGRSGVSAFDIVQVAKANGLEAWGKGSVEPEDLPGELAQGPVILGWVPNHFVVAESASSSGLTILDPALGRRWVPMREAKAFATGIVLGFSPTAALVPIPKAPWEGARAVRAILSDRFSLLVIVLAGVGGQALGMASTLSLRVVIEQLGQGPTQEGLAMLAGLAGAAGVGALLEFMKTRLYLTLALLQDGASFRGFIAKLLDLPVSWHQARGSADLLQRLGMAQESGAALTRLMVDGMTSLGMALGAGTLVGLFNPLALLVGVLVMGFGIWSLAGRTRRIQAEARPQMMELGKAHHLATEFVASAEWLEVSGLRAWARQRSLAAVQSWGRASRLGAARMSVLQVEQGLLGVLVLISIVAVLVWRVGLGQMGPGQVGVAIMASALMVGALTSLAGVLGQVLALAPALERIADVVNAPLEAGGGHQGPVRGEIEVRNLAFRYWASGPLVLDGISLRIQAGEMVGLVGASGSGKSTLGHLLAGLRRGQGGQVLLDGVPLESWDEETLRGSVAVVLQKPEVFRGTIRNNLLLGARYSDQDCWNALRLAQLDGRVVAMGGLDGKVDAQGSNLSGGERQRLALARAILWRPRVLILDEATSALDLPTEAAIVNGLKGLAMTRVVITHRLESLAAADRVLHLVGGRIHV